MVEVNFDKNVALEKKIAGALDKLFLEFKNEISEDLLKSFVTLLSELKTKGVSVTDCKKSQPVLIFGKANLSKLLRKYIDPHLYRLQDILHKDLYLDISFTECSMLNFRFGKVAAYCDHLLDVSQRLSDSVDLNFKYSIASDLAFIRLMLLNIHSLSSTYPFKTCKVCFRRIFSNKYCWLHKSGNTDFYNQAKRIAKFQDIEMRLFIEKWKAKRMLLGEHPNITPIADGGGVDEKVDVYEITIAIPRYIYNLIKSFSQPDWSAGRNVIDNYIKNELPLINSLIEGQTNAVGSFSEYIRRIYKPRFLDNRYETSTSELWFFFTLLEAESFLKAERDANNTPDLRTKDTTERDNKIIKLRKEGGSFRKIANEIKVSKSLVEKICKNNI